MAVDVVFPCKMVRKCQVPLGAPVVDWRGHGCSFILGDVGVAFTEIRVIIGIDMGDVWTLVSL